MFGNPNSDMYSWQYPPAPIGDDEIVATYTADVAIIGLGYAGLSICRTLAEEGCSVIVAETQSRERWWTFGHDIANINSHFQKEHGVPEVDPIEFMNNWQIQCQGKANPYFTMTFATKSGPTVDWFLEPVPQEIKDKVHITFFPDNEYTIHQLNNGYRFYPGTLQWWEDNWNGKGMRNNGKGLELKNLSWANVSYIEENFPKAQILFNTMATQLVRKGKKVCGFIAQTEDGDYIRILGRKGVVLCGGGFGGNQEMCRDLLPHMQRTFAPGENFMGPFDRGGSTIQMGVWAGGRLETEISSMNFDSIAIPDYLPGPLWVDSEGCRFQNEGFAGPEINGYFYARSRRGILCSVFDSTYDTQILRGYPGHQAFDYSEEHVVRDMMQNFADARTAGRKGTRKGFFCADTLEELARCLEYDEQQTKNFLQTIERYNELCDLGADWDFGKDPRFMNPVRKGPFYAHKTKPNLGFALVTTGAFVTTNHQQVLDERYKPIAGLYASGNTCGLRFGASYITPMPGMSIGMALTLGRDLGLYLASLPDEIV